MTTAQIRAMTGDEMEARHLEIHEATKKRQLATPSGYSCCDRCDIYYFVEDSYKYPIKGNRFFLYCVDCTKELLATKGSIAQPRQTIEPEYTQSELDSEIKRQKSIAVQAVARGSGVMLFVFIKHLSSEGVYIIGYRLGVSKT